ncbi:MAG: alpha/beta fold hydrolase [Xanthomonadaceae bacterium]|jgi:predicted alpha/beta-fold hydrolase|nr:alpha/beta fold hydrolase [Xanthomonadaceae bacterium]
MNGATHYRPPRWLRNPHLQSVLSTSSLRRQRGLRALVASGAVNHVHVLDVGKGVRLQGCHSYLPERRSRALALLLHGWEGSTESSYMRMTAAQLLRHGFEIFRLNFRDHGDTHHLNPGLFHSGLLDEVADAAATIVQQFSVETLVVAGFSLGGNFALRLALRAEPAGLPLKRVAAICPLINPSTAVTNARHGGLYDWYFRSKWRASLVRKRELFPELHDYDDATLAQDTRGLMASIALREGFESLEEYFDCYTIADDRLMGLKVPAHILMAEDDPVIPVSDFQDWRLPGSVQLEIAECGGHCGFIVNASGDGFAERWIAQKLKKAIRSDSQREHGKLSALQAT